MLQRAEQTLGIINRRYNDISKVCGLGIERQIYSIVVEAFWQRTILDQMKCNAVKP